MAAAPLPDSGQPEMLLGPRRELVAPQGGLQPGMSGTVPMSLQNDANRAIERESQGPSQPRITRYKDGDIIAADTVWQGMVLVDGVVFVPEGVTLTVTPGCAIGFTRSDAEYRESGVPEAVIPGSGIRVEGRFIAEGTVDAPIIFMSADDNPEPGAWGCIFFNHSKDSSFRYCQFQDSTYTLHAHFSSLDIKRCTITGNIDGSRLGYSKVLIENCDITGNTGKGLNFANCRNTVRYCNITGNYEGIFLNEHDAACVIEENNIHGNSRFDLSLGEFHDEDIATGFNWWGSANTGAIADKVYDSSDDPEIGTASISPARREIPNAGPSGLAVTLLWKFGTGGYVDSSPAVDSGRVYFGSWDHSLYCLDEKTGDELWKFTTGDCVDSSPAVADGKVYFGSWDRNIYCLDAESGKELWRYSMEPGQFDDHRQSSPVVAAGVLYIGGFNGYIYALDAETGSVLWKSATEGPVRSRPLVFSGLLSVMQDGKPLTEVVASSGDGLVYALTGPDGGVLWKAGGGDRVTSSPLFAGSGIVFGGGDGRVHCVDRLTGEKKWDVMTGGRVEYSSPLLVDNLVYTGSTDGLLYAMDATTGSLVWSFDTGGVIYSSPQGFRDRVAVGNNHGELWWLDSKTGTPLGVFHAKEAVQGLTALPGGTAYAGSRDGYLYSLSIGN